MTRLLRRRYVIPTALVVTLLATGGFVYARRTTDTVQYRTAAATLGTVTQTISLSGNLTPSNTTALDFGGSGKVTAVNVQPGAQVTAGEVLATLDTTSEQATLQQAQATLASAQAKLAQDQAGATAAQVSSAQSSVSSAQVSLTNAVTSENDTRAVNAQSIVQAQAAMASAQNSVNADQNVVSADQSKLQSDQQQQQTDCNADPSGSACSADNGTVSSDRQKLAGDQQTLAKDQGSLSNAQTALQATQVKAQQSDDQAAAQVASAQVQVQNARNALAALSQSVTPQQVQMDQAQVSIDQVSADNAQRAVDQSTLVAPAAGVVGEVNVSAGQQVGSTGGNGSSSASSSSASSHAIVLLTPGAFTVSGTVTDAQVGEIAVGQRADILPAGSTEAVTGKVTAVAPEATVSSGVATFTVTITLDGSQPALHAGSSASISVIVNQVVQVLTVPTSAVRGSTVQVLVNGAPQTRPVQVGASDALRTQILSGVNPGDPVVIATVSGTVPTTSTTGGGGIFGAGGGGGGGFRGAGGAGRTGGGGGG
jgi:multidrug efflux pump subunit AcrA (membrane-fusion protein)